MTVIEKAYAKINLFLDVTGRRDDGYHDVDTLMCSVSLHDSICLNVTPSDKISITINSDAHGLETDETNLVYKAAIKYLSKFEKTADVRAILTKRIPIGAGLGGGSSDAAATLRAMNKVFGLATKTQLLEMAAELGSDVPFCVEGKSAFCSGRGEVVRHQEIKKQSNVVIAIGEGRVSTPKAYALLDEKFGDFKDNNAKNRHPNTGSLPHYNIFESVIKLDDIDIIKKTMTDKGAKHTLMSGSGPAVFGIFGNCIEAYFAKRALKKHGFLAFKCRMI